MVPLLQSRRSNFANESRKRVMDDERPGGSKKGLRRDSELQRISRSRFCPEQPVPPFLKSRRRRLFRYAVA